jgi:hypothetical protein
VNWIWDKDQLKTFLYLASPRSAGRHLGVAPASLIAEPDAQAPLQQHQRDSGFDSKPLAFWFPVIQKSAFTKKFSRAIVGNTAKKSTMLEQLRLTSKVSFCNRFEIKRNPPPVTMRALPVPISLSVLSSHLPKEISESVPAGIPLFLIKFSDRS